MKHIRLDDHITHGSGRQKTVCVTACLTAFGVPVEGFHYTGTADDNTKEAILRRYGYSVRSRKSKMPKQLTMGKVRKGVKKLNDPVGTKYLVTLWGSGYCHCILLDSDGNTVVDTDPKKRDKRKVYRIKAVFKN